MQRAPEPQRILASVSDLLLPGGLAFITCRSGTGFDILTLREHSQSIFPLDHLCLPSPRGMQVMLENAGLRVIELATPGLLDVEYVKNDLQHIPHEQYFQRYIMAQSDNRALERLQQFLQHNNLSSYLQVVAQKTGETG